MSAGIKQAPSRTGVDSFHDVFTDVKRQLNWPGSGSIRVAYNICFSDLNTKLDTNVD